MSEINLLERYPRADRPIEERGRRRLAREGWLSPPEGSRRNIDILVEYQMLNRARQFGREYFDADRLYGYGGYYYDPRFWRDTVERFRDHYQLAEDACVLDVGCAKGFMMYDFRKLMPRLNLRGIDISQYAHDNAIPEMKPFMDVGNCRELPYAGQSFDLVISINTVDHLPIEECKQALREIVRVSRKDAFVCVNAWRNDAERERLLKWNVTAQSCMHVDEWRRVFSAVGYEGDYWWFIAE